MWWWTALFGQVEAPTRLSPQLNKHCAPLLKLQVQHRDMHFRHDGPHQSIGPDQDWVGSAGIRSSVTIKIVFKKFPAKSAAGWLVACLRVKIANALNELRYE